MFINCKTPCSRSSVDRRHTNLISLFHTWSFNLLICSIQLTFSVTFLCFVTSFPDDTLDVFTVIYLNHFFAVLSSCLCPKLFWHTITCITSPPDTTTVLRSPLKSAILLRTQQTADAASKKCCRHSSHAKRIGADSIWV